MQLSGPQVITALRDKLKFDSGRHLYAVLGTYERLEEFANKDLASATDPNGLPFPKPLNLNKALLANINDEDLRNLVNREAKRPQQINQHLNDQLNRVVQHSLNENPFLILKQIELMFAYDLDFSTLRRHASNQNRILLLLPGQQFGDHVVLFHQGGDAFQRPLPNNVIAENHLWELEAGK